MPKPSLVSTLPIKNDCRTVKPLKSPLKGVLLINLGTPDQATYSAVYRYLTEFLTDPRVIDMPWLKRQLLVRGLIIPLRLKSSTHAYQSIWTKDGSPLLAYGRKTQMLLQQTLGAHYSVVLAMRYQNPSIALGLKTLLDQGADEIIILPLFPQYASATTGSIFEKVTAELSLCRTIPKVTFIDQFFDHTAFISAYASLIEPYLAAEFDHLLFSFHGLPARHLRDADRNKLCNPNGNCSPKTCCETIWPENRACYAAQCYATARLLRQQLELASERASVCFQSRLGKDPWIGPSTADLIEMHAKKGAKRLLVCCPSFVCDCLETLYEIGLEYQELFHRHGGKELILIPGLNEKPVWIEALKEIVCKT